MKLTKRLAITLLAAVLAVFALSGCTADEIGLTRALADQPLYTSYEYEADLSVNVDFDMNAAADQDYMYTDYRMIENVLEDAGFGMSAKYEGSEDMRKGAAEVWVTPRMFGGSLENLATGIWAEVDLDSEEPVKEYFKLPRLYAVGELGDRMKGREYISVTSNELNELYDGYGLGGPGYMFTPEYMERIQDASLSLNDTLSGALVSLAGYLDTDTAYVQSVTDLANGGKSYEVKVTDAGLKELLRSIVNMDKEDMRALAKTLTDALTEYARIMSEGGGTASVGIIGGADGPTSAIVGDELAGLDAIFGGENSPFDTMYPQIVEELNALLDAADKMKLLGGDGLTLGIDINDDGYVTRFDIALDMVLDFRGAAIASGERFYGDVNKASVKIDFTNKMSNINGNVSVSMPRITDRNAISLTELLEPETAAYEDSVYVDEYAYIDPGIAYAPDGMVE